MLADPFLQATTCGTGVTPVSTSSVALKYATLKNLGLAREGEADEAAATDALDAYSQAAELDDGDVVLWCAPVKLLLAEMNNSSHFMLHLGQAPLGWCRPGA